MRSPVPDEPRRPRPSSRAFEIYTRSFAKHADGWIGLAECNLELRQLDEALQAADRAIGIDATAVAAWIVRGNCQKATGQLDKALNSYRKANQLRPTAEGWFKAGQIHLEIQLPREAIDAFDHAIKLAPGFAAARAARGEALSKMGRLEEAVNDFRAALTLEPADAECLKKACYALLDLKRSSQALDLCNDVLRAQPDAPAARIVREWILNQLVPSWHVPMMNEPERNQAYSDALAAAITPETVVFEIGTGSGLLAMMAVRHGAKKVVSCEAIDLIAHTAEKLSGATTCRIASR